MMKNWLSALDGLAERAMETVPLIRVTNISRTLESLKDAGVWCLGLEGSAEASLNDCPMPPRTALVLGAEGHGLRRLVRQSCDMLARIPITDFTESLNISNAAAIALYEYKRAL